MCHITHLSVSSSSGLVVVIVLVSRSAMVSGSGTPLVSRSASVNTPAATATKPKMSDGNHGTRRPCRECVQPRITHYVALIETFIHSFM